MQSSSQIKHPSKSPLTTNSLTQSSVPLSTFWTQNLKWANLQPQPAWALSLSPQLSENIDVNSWFLSSLYCWHSPTPCKGNEIIWTHHNVLHTLQKSNKVTHPVGGAVWSRGLDLHQQMNNLNVTRKHFSKKGRKKERLFNKTKVNWFSFTPDIPLACSDKETLNKQLSSDNVALITVL